MYVRDCVAMNVRVCMLCMCLTVCCVHLCVRRTVCVCDCVCMHAQVSSVAGQCGIFGYSAYSASKFALTGFAQCLQMEVKRYGVAVSLVFPPDTDTPMFHEENKIKPPETAEISKVCVCVCVCLPHNHLERVCLGIMHSCVLACISPLCRVRRW